MATRPVLLGVLSLVLVGLAAKALIPDLVYDELACLAAADPGNATTDDTDDDGKPVPPTDTTPGKFVRAHANFSKAFLATVDFASPHLLMPVHALAVSDAATEALLPDQFLPNAETGPPAGARSCRLTRPSVSHPQQTFPVALAARRNPAPPLVWIEAMSDVTRIRDHVRQGDPTSVSEHCLGNWYLGRSFIWLIGFASRFRTIGW